MNKDMYGRYCKSFLSSKKKLGLSVAYAIVALIVAAVAIAGLTPVLTRKLPNLSTSSIIKNPKGWYESFNAPTVGAKYCKKCLEYDTKYKECLNEVKEGKEKIENCPKEPINLKWDDYSDVVEAKNNDPCFGNPACIPFVSPDDVNPKDPKKHPSKIVAFEQYCKSNGDCNPNSDALDDTLNKDKNTLKICQNANINKITNKFYNKLKPCPCPNGACEFKPADGVTKYEIFAIGGGGASGSAVAADPSNPSSKNIKDKSNEEKKTDEYYKKSVIGSATGDLPNKNLTKDLTVTDNTKGIADVDLLDTKLYPKANFIDQNRIVTIDKNNKNKDPYNPGDFNDPKGNNANYPNILKNSDTKKCATGIIYTIGKADNNFHTYPTEDNNSELAKSSTRQIKKMLGNKEYLIGKRSVYYFDRYYLYTRYLGAYNYKQDPVYLLMPEWVMVDNNDKRYPNDDDSINNGYGLTDHEGIPREEINCSGKNKEKCYIGNYDTEHPNNLNSIAVNAIMSYYSLTASVACSGNGSNGANVIAKKPAGSESCAWMKPTACRFFINDLIKTPVEGDIKDIEGDDSSKCPHAKSSDGEIKLHMPPACWAGVSNPPIQDSEGKVIGLHCVYTVLFKDRKCAYQDYINSYVTCKCPVKDIPDHCEDNDDAIQLCTNTKVETLPDPNLAEQAENLAKYFQENTEDAITNTFTLSNSRGDSITFGVTSGGQIYAPDPVYGYTSYFGAVAPLRSEITGEVNEMTKEKAQEILNQASEYFNEHYKDKAMDLSALTDLGGGEPYCTLNKDYVRNAYGGAKGIGVCGYKIARIARNAVESTSVTPNKNGMGNNAQKVGIHGSCGGRTNGKQGEAVNACIKPVDKPSDCALVSGGHGGEGGIVNCPVCTGSASNGKKGDDGSVSNGGYFPKSEMSRSNNNPLKYDSDALTVLNASKIKSKNNSNTNKSNKDNEKNTNGTLKTPGRYNYRYMWYMPFVTKHLMFGTAGEGGEEVHTLVTLSKGQSLTVVPGQGAGKTNYLTGGNGKSGEVSTVKNQNANINILAHGGKGGIGSQKTDEYVLCHISDLQKEPNLPCYYKDTELNDFKSTHKIDKNGKFAGILAALPKISTTVNSIKMSKNLKLGLPGSGAMGYGTKSVSDVICEERHVTKWDEIEGQNIPYDSGKDVNKNKDTKNNTKELNKNNKNSDKNKDTKNNTKDVASDRLLSSGGKIYNVCKGNSKIKYILPHGSEYSAGTGAVIIVW